MIGILTQLSIQIVFFFFSFNEIKVLELTENLLSEEDDYSLWSSVREYVFNNVFHTRASNDVRAIIEKEKKNFFFFFRVANNSRIWNYDLNDAIGRDGWVLMFWRGTTKNWWHFFLVWVRQRATILTKKELAQATSIHQSLVLSLRKKYIYIELIWTYRDWYTHSISSKLTR
jgi:hypothetical protein